MQVHACFSCSVCRDTPAAWKLKSRFCIFELFQGTDVVKSGARKWKADLQAVSSQLLLCCSEEPTFHNSTPRKSAICEQSDVFFALLVVVD